MTASLTLDRIPLGEVLKAIPNWTLDVKGIVSGKAELKGPYDKLSDTTAWTGSADVTAPELVVAGRIAKGAKLSASVAKGTPEVVPPAEVAADDRLLLGPGRQQFPRRVEHVPGLEGERCSWSGGCVAGTGGQATVPARRAVPLLHRSGVMA